MIDFIPNIEQLLELRAAFVRHNRDIRLVGGCVRDVLLGTKPADIDLCTNATPEEQAAIYTAENIHFIETGVKHGTYTVILQNKIILEITSLRIDTVTDGRHAVVEYTHDWILDLSRRDLTINAMSLTFDNVLIDPFNGADDLKNGRVVFVGDAKQRIEEDYLRILRWFRFSARYIGENNLDSNVLELLTTDVSKGLLKISRERIWSEIKKIAVGPNSFRVFNAMIATGVHEYIDLPVGWAFVFLRNHKNAISLLTAYCLYNSDVVKKISEDWKWSNEEKSQAQTMCKLNALPFITLKEIKKEIILGIKKEWAIEFYKMRSTSVKDKINAELLEKWDIPVFPITGGDIIDIGFMPGPIITTLMHQIRDKWIESDCTLSKEQCIALIGEVNAI